MLDLDAKEREIAGAIWEAGYPTMGVHINRPYGYIKVEYTCDGVNHTELTEIVNVLRNVSGIEAWGFYIGAFGTQVDVCFRSLDNLDIFA